MAITAAGIATGAKVGSSSTVTAPSVSVTAGQLLVVYLARWNYVTSTAPVAGDCTKSSGTATIGTVTRDHYVSGDDGGGVYMQAAVFSAVVTGSGTLTMQIANGDAGAYQCIAVEAFNPSAGRSWGSNRVDGTPAGAVDSSNDFTSFSSGNVSTTADGIIVGVVQVDVSDDGTITQDGAFTLVYESETGSTDNTGSAIYRIVSSGTTDSADWSLSFSTKFGVAGVAVAYRQEPQVTYVSSPSIVTNDFGGSAGTHTATVPTSIGSGDLWTVAMVIDSNAGQGSPSTPSGWTKAYQDAVGGTGTPGYPTIALFWKIAGTSESSQAFTISSGAYQVHSQSSRWQNAHQSAPIGNTTLTSAYTASTATGYTTHDPGNLIVQDAGSMAVAHLGAQRYGPGTSTPSMPSDMTQVYSRGGAASGIYDKGGLAYLSRSTSGTYSPNDVTFSTDVMNIVHRLFEIRPFATAAAGPTLPQVVRGRTMARGFGRGTR